MDTSDQYFGCLCRTCMNKLIEASSIDGDSEPQQQWQFIFDMIEEEYGRLPIAELLSQAVPKLELQLSDELPKKICCKCLQELLSVYRFQQMCLQSEQQMRQQVSKNKTVLSIPAATAASDIGAHSFPLDNSSIQEPLLETTALVVKTEAAETSAVDHLLNIDQMLEDCKDSQGNFSEFIKDAPVMDDGALSYSSASSQPGTTHQNLDDSSIQEPLLEATDKIVTQVETETSATDHFLRNDQLQEVSQGNFSEFVKNEPIEDDEPEMEYSDGDTIQSIISVKDEILAIETEEEISETCEFCPSEFSVAKELRAHLSTHKNEDSKTREQNRKARQEAETKLKLQFSKKEQVETKAKIYSEDKPYECPYCPRRFNIKSSLRYHKTFHEGANREDCDICGKSMIKSHLKKHKLIHSKEKAHKCGICKKRFTQPSHLHTHMRLHTGEKPFKCHYCESTFARPQNRTSHMRNLHLGVNVYRCELCPLAFPTSKELRMHFTSHKNEDSETRERNMKALQEAEAKLQLKLSKKETRQPSKQESQQQFKKKAK